MMTHEDFRRAILATPDDDTLRLIYADWLDEQGDVGDRELARLIRIQCEAETAPRSQKARLNREAQAIIKANEEWTRAIKKAKFANPVYRRGLLHQISIGATKFTYVSNKAFAQFPTLRSVRFLEAANEIERLAKCPNLARLTEIDLSRLCVCNNCPIERDVAAIIESPHVGNLITLSLAKNRIADTGAEAIAGSTAFPKLRELDLSKNQIGDVGAVAFMTAKWMTNLTSLNLKDNPIGTETRTALLETFGKKVVRL